MSVTRYLGGEPTEVLAASHNVDPAFDPTRGTDRGTEAHLALASGATARITCDMAVAWRFGFVPPLPRPNLVVTGEKGEVALDNFLMPTLWHMIRVRTNEGGVARTRTEKVYEAGRGKAWWSM
jgi:predicted dehydrogenase